MPSTTSCSGGCGRQLDLTGCRPCAILICMKCRQNRDTLRKVRTKFFQHIDEHIKEGRKQNPFYPFSNIDEAFMYA